MTDYVQVNDFSAKDALSKGDTNKKIRGSEVDTELANIATAITSKADHAGDTYTGTHSFEGSLRTTGTFQAPIITNSVIADAKGLVVTTNSSNPLFQLDIDADSIILEDASGIIYEATSVNLTVDITATGVNGRDTGSESDAWWYAWVIYDGTNIRGVLSLSSTLSGVTLPSGYTFGGLVGAVSNSSGDFVNFRQVNKRAILDSISINGNTDIGTSANLETLPIPPNTISIAWIRGAQGSSTTSFITTETWQTDSAASNSNRQFAATGSANQQAVDINLRVDSSSQLRVRANDSTADYDFAMMGWVWE